MTANFSRRQFLRSAGGLTFLAFTPAGRGLFAAAAPLKPLNVPIFLALPYIQPGPNAGLLPGAEVIRLAWQTEQRDADFVAEFGRDEDYGAKADITRTSRNYSLKKEGDSRYNYVCSFGGLELDSEYRYRLRCNGEVVLAGYFTTRQPRGRRIRFAAFGDNSFGDVSDRAIAYQAYRAHPDFVMNTGDNVYENGLDNEYGRYFFPVYNADEADPRVGAPLLRSVPFYTVIANHDVNGKDPATKAPCADFDTDVDSLAIYTNFHFPLNGPAALAQPTVYRGAEGVVNDFKACAGDRFPRMANYSYDYGDAHFLCLDSNIYTDPTDAALQQWIEADLAASDALWKFAVFHHPAFNVGMEHYQEQQMRALCPLLEKHGVDFALSGHEHGYQRTRPLRFAPRDLAKAHALQAKDRRIPGDFTIDTEFDGEKTTKAAGIIHITTGAGGKHLYDPGYTDEPTKWLHADDNNVAYVAQMISDRHSLTIFDIEGAELIMRQIDEDGNEVDKIQVTKA
ncbi:MAG TPA: metallophosphoesterase [Opitutales bacterium]|jgi:hypothetical protein|nr:metallophosphoesterase [Opitutales bacterium]